MITGTDLSVLFNPFVSGGAVVIVAVILGVPWVSRRYIFRELDRDTGVTRGRRIALFAPGREGNPPLVYFLELLYTTVSSRCSCCTASARLRAFAMVR